MSSDGELRKLSVAKVDIDALAGSKEPARTEPEQVEFSKLPRAQRRRIAKKARLFKDKSGEAWRIASNHMKRNGPPTHNHKH